MPHHDETGKPLTKKERMARQKAAADERKALAAAEANRMEPDVRPHCMRAVRKENGGSFDCRSLLHAASYRSKSIADFLKIDRPLLYFVSVTHGSLCMHLLSNYGKAACKHQNGAESAH